MLIQDTCSCEKEKQQEEEECREEQAKWRSCQVVSISERCRAGRRGSCRGGGGGGLRSIYCGTNDHLFIASLLEFAGCKLTDCPRRLHPRMHSFPTMHQQTQMATVTQRRPMDMLPKLQRKQHLPHKAHPSPSLPKTIALRIMLPIRQMLVRD